MNRVGVLTRSASAHHVYVRLGRRTAYALALAGATGAAGAAYVSSSEARRRQFTFNATALPALVQYRYWDWRLKDADEAARDAKFSELHQRWAPAALKMIKDMGGFYIKGGQVLSGLDGLVPKEWVEAFKELQDRVEPRPFKEVRRQLERELGRPLEEVFASVDEEPIGTASIGQVHRARLVDGRVVAVKVLHPDAERLFRTDVATSKAFTKIAQPEQLPIFEEIESHFQTEFDFRREALNLAEISARVGKDPRYAGVVVTPEPIPELCTRGVLVMTFLNGKSLRRMMKDHVARVAEAQGKSVAEVEAELREDATAKGSKKPAAPPSRAVLAAVRVGVAARDAVRNGLALAYNTLVGSWAGGKIPYAASELPVDSYAALDRLYAVTASQVFEWRAFNSDCHPGNVLLLQDGRVGLIDYGQVKRATPDVTLRFAKLVVALAEDDASEAATKRIADAWRACGYKTKRGLDQPTADFARFFFDRYTSDVSDRWGGATVMLEQLGAADPIEVLPKDYVMAGRASLLLRANAAGLGHTTGRFSSVAKVWEGAARACIAEAERGEVGDRHVHGAGAAVPVPA